MSYSAYVQVPPAQFISGTAEGFTVPLRREGIVPFKSLLVGGERGLWISQRGKLPRRESRLDDREVPTGATTHQSSECDGALTRCTNSTAYCRYILFLTGKKTPQLLI